jgi:hypothetical protein
MDAVKFVEERRRMFAVTGENPKYSLFNMSTCAEDVVKEVEEWSAAHPRKTRQSVFLEQWPEAEIDKCGCLMLCPLTVSAEHRNRHGDCTTLVCSGCRRKFWMQEVE